MVPSTKLDGDYDYIVVGAGSAGCVVANRLSTDRDNRVLVLEAGGNDNWIWFHIPVGYLFAIGNPRSDWMFETVKEAGLNGRSLKYPRGKVVGGSSAINAMISMRGQASDYDHWRQLGLTGWGWDDVRPVFKRLDDHFMGESEHHGVGGEWRVERPGVRWDVLDSVAKAAVEMGIPMTPDFNTGDNTGVGYFHVNQKRGFRWSSARGFLKPVLHRANLRLETGVLVEKVLFEGKRAVGVRYRQHGRTIEVRAKGEVILSAGSIGSPEILQRSGVGPAEWLGEFGITTVANRPGVGRNLQDHLQQRAVYRVHGTKTLNETYHSLIGRALMGLEYRVVPARPSHHGAVPAWEFSRPHRQTSIEQTSSFTSNHSRSINSVIRCIASRRSRFRPAISGRRPAAPSAFVRPILWRNLLSHRTIFRPTKIDASQPTRSALPAV